MNNIGISLWKDYVALETDLLGIIETIPLVREHLDSPWSPKLRDLLNRIYSSYEDLFGIMIEYSEYEDVRRQIMLEKVNINYYRELLDPIHNLSSKKVFVKGLDLMEIQPFIGFVENENKIPKWWTNMNKVRHKWSNNKKLANLKNSLEAMSGLFLLNILYKPNRLELAKLGVIHEQYIRSEHQWKKILLELAPGYISWKFTAETEIFILNFPEKMELRDYFGL